ncbi:MAG: hypothetical protein PVH91_09520 [Pseudomonadales bacterium]|jgi:hypothetical protein
MTIRTTILAALLAAGLAGNAYPCGDNAVYRVGKGVAYRVYTAPLPGHVLVYGRTDAARALARELVQSGHSVRLVSSDQELRSELESGVYDVVIAPYDEHSVVESESRTAVGSPSLVPVAETPGEERQARERYEHVIQARKADIKQYLIAIHKTLQHRG